MLRNMMGFYDLATQTIESSNGSLTWGKMRDTIGDLLYKLTSMKFEVKKNANLNDCKRKCNIDAVVLILISGDF